MHEIELKPSRRLGLLLAAMTGLVWAGLWLAALPLGLRIGVGLAVAALALRAWRGACQPARLRLRADGCLQLRDATGEWDDLEVLGDSFVSPPLIVMRYRVEGAGPRRRALTLLPDSVDAEELRRLRVWLRWARRTRSDTSSPGAG